MRGFTPVTTDEIPPRFAHPPLTKGGRGDYVSPFDKGGQGDWVTK